MSVSSPTLTLVGLGYIGLPTAVVMANHGIRVTGFDTDAAAVERINRGEVTIVEPGLQEELESALASGYFRASTRISAADTYVIAVPTPFTANHEADLSFVMAAAESIAGQLTGGELIILESTSPPTTTRKLAAAVLKLRPDLAADGSDNPEGKPVVYFAYCPERILPGRSLEELTTNSRIIGGQTPRAAELACKVYRTFCTGELAVTDDVTAELAKLTENSYRDVNIAFANELSMVASGLGVDVWELISLANRHPRVNILQPGPGVGGHCIAVDPWFIVSADPDNSHLMRTARQVNDSKPGWVLDRVESTLGGRQSPVIAVLGLAFKADIDDLRGSPAVAITRELAERFPQATILAVEPHIEALPDTLGGYVNLELTGFEAALERAELVLLLVDHREFTALSAAELHQKLDEKHVIDTRGVWR